MSEASLLSAKLQKYGCVGAGVISDSMATLKLAEQASQEKAKGSTNAGGYAATPAGPPVALAPATGSSSSSKPAPVDKGGLLSRSQILDVLTKTVEVQGIVQVEVSKVARQLAQEKGEKTEGKKSKKKVMTFLEASEKIKALNLPKEPLEEMGVSEADFQKLLTEYEEDEEVMTKAQELIHPPGKGDPARAESITLDKIIEIHHYMATEMQKVLTEFLQLDGDTRRQFSGKACETTAELMVSVAVEQQMKVHCEDVEQAVIRHEETLQQNAEFARCTEQLAAMMGHLTAAAQIRVEKEDFVKVLKHMGESSSKAKVFAKKLFDDYKSNSCGIKEAYERFEDFALNGTNPPEKLEELSSVELQLCYDEYREDPEVESAWQNAGIDMNMMMSNLGMPTKSSSSGSASVEDKKDKKDGKKAVKTSDIVEMQELMVDELKRCWEQALKCIAGKDKPKSPWKPEIAMQMVQALASAAVEKRYGVSAEEMTMAGFQHAATLQKNERFVRATEKQQDILMNVCKMCTNAYGNPNKDDTKDEE
eukprot:TRINITY_DN16270_c1_g1_i1.p1 TRINITY_DN16270_c1_g1~~TRINITY_DN16270_c1_g1_i1.p1  ORF type:complete len:535 (+),score=167.49 TRINITY_DN16270_c1_g1_i1:82-1686(+)